MTAWLSFVHVGAELHHLGSASPTVSLRLIKLNELILLDFQNLNEKCHGYLAASSHDMK